MKLIGILFLNILSLFAVGQEKINLNQTYYSQGPLNIENKQTIVLINEREFDDTSRVLCHKWKFLEDGSVIIRSLDFPDELNEKEKQAEKKSEIKIPRARAVLDVFEMSWELESNELKLILNDKQYIFSPIQTTEFVLNLVYTE